MMLDISVPDDDGWLIVRLVIMPQDKPTQAIAHWQRATCNTVPCGVYRYL